MKKSLLLVLFLWLAGIVAGMQFAKFSSTIQILQTEIGITQLYSGWLLSSLGIIGLLFGISAGIVVSRFSPLRLVIIFLIWASASSFLQTMFTQPILMLIIRILEGFSQLILVSAAPTALLKYTPKKHQTVVMTFWGTFFGAAFLFMNLIQKSLINLGGWKMIFWFHALFAAIIAITLLFLSKNTSDEKNHIQSEKISIIQQHKAVYTKIESILPGLLFVCSTMVYLVFFTYLPIYFNELYPNEVFKSNFLVISMPLFSLLGTFLSGLILSKQGISPLKLIQYGFTIMIVLSISITFNLNPVFLITIASLILICTGLLQGSIFATVPYLSNDSKIHAYANGGITQMGNLGTTLGAPIFSSLLVYFNWKIAFLLPVASSSLGIFLVLYFSKKLSLKTNTDSISTKTPS